MNKDEKFIINTTYAVLGLQMISGILATLIHLLDQNWWDALAEWPNAGGAILAIWVIRMLAGSK